MNIKPKYIVLSMTLAVAATFAATTFTPNSQPFGYIGPSVLSSTSFEDGNTVAYATWFDAYDFKGNLIAYPMSKTGVPQILSPKWNAAGQLATQNHLTGRNIVTTDGAGTATAFLWDDITAAQRTALLSENHLLFIRGDTTKDGEAATPRNRGSILGAIIHSNPVYVEKPVSAYSDAAYLAFSATHKDRKGMVYVGANDGMLHAFDADTGLEEWAYIPSMVIPNLEKLARDPYSPTYFVDGHLNYTDVYYDLDWHSLLVGGLGPGGKGYFALDITLAETANETEAASKVLWEFHSGSTGATNLGYGYSRPSVAKTAASGTWAVFVGNGYMSSTGAASLYVLNAKTGAVMREIIVPDTNANGLSSPSVIDSNGDGKVDIAYAGDRNGNVWRFDISSTDPASWNVYQNKPLFQTALQSDGNRQPITTAPEVGNAQYPYGGFMVYVATGELFDPFAGMSTEVQSVYGIWDQKDGWSADTLPISKTDLEEQTFYAWNHGETGASVRTASNNSVDLADAVDKGWYMDLLVDNPAPLDYGEKVLQDIKLRDDRVEFVSINTTNPTGENWYMQLNAFTGGAPTKTIVDVNDDRLLNTADNVDVDNDTNLEDVAEERVIGSYLGFGLSSGPTVGGNKGDSSTALFNHIEAIPPVTLTSLPDDPGLVGGHFDLDTSHGIYQLGEGDTDGHVHEWDDDYATSTIDYFNMVPENKLYGINDGTNAVPDNTTEFFVTISNTYYNSAGVMEINGSSFSVGTYFDLQTRWMTGTLGPGEVFPGYILGVPTAEQSDRGIQQLTSLKISFDTYAIIKGELLGTETGCVRGNDAGILGEYRNGALTIQALDGEDFNGFVYDSANDVYVAANTALDGTHQYARLQPGDPEEGDDEVFGKSMFWESTVFWHWDGDCYGQGDWQAQYDACKARAEGSFCWVPADTEDKADKTKDKDADKSKDKDNNTSTPVDDPTDTTTTPPESDPEHRLEAIITGDSSREGRLYWRELIPE